MKSLSIFFFLMTLIFNLACSLPAEQTGLAKQNQTPTPNLTIEKLDKPEESYLREDENIVNRSGDIKAVLIGYLTVKNGKVVSETIGHWARIRTTTL